MLDLGDTLTITSAELRRTRGTVRSLFTVVPLSPSVSDDEYSRGHESNDISTLQFGGPGRALPVFDEANGFLEISTPPLSPR